MATKRGRSPSLIDNEPLAKRGNIENTYLPLQHPVNGAGEAPAPVTCTNLSDCTFTTATASSVPLIDANAVSEAQNDTSNAVQADISSAGVQDQQESDNMAVPLPLMEQLVVAPEFEMTHDSWEAFDEALKVYGKMTYQLYVIRSTTSVKRRNIKIGESTGKGNLVGNAGTFRRVGMELGISAAHEMIHVAEKLLIPEYYQWYSKSLKCTHGWKNRYRSTGKRGSGVVRSTSCPVKMCVTLQHRGSGPNDWKVVVTKHVRTHNHQLSKELYLYYSENRRIYDADLLAVAGDTLASKSSVDFESANLSSLIDQAYQRPSPSRMLLSNEDQSQQQQASPMVFMVSDSSSARDNVDSRTITQLMPLSDRNFVNQSHTPLTATTTPMPPLGAMILTPGTIPSRAMDGGGFSVPRVSIKVHACWTAFHDYVAQYAFDTLQVFRTRSTVSVAARNAKILALVAAKTGGGDHDVASYANHATAAPMSRLIPDECKWFSKLLICTYGWKRRVQSKATQLGEQEDGPCPAMLLARIERNVNGNWQVIINRQVAEHNHQLGRQADKTGANNHEPLGEIAGILAPAQQTFDSTIMPQTSDTDQSVMIEMQSISAQSGVKESQTSSSNQREIVVRVPRIQSMFSSWNDFHASLKVYSDATYQLYRTRTTSSVKGRNKKIMQMKNKSEDNNDNENTDSDLDTALNGANAARKIPKSWRWYSKTLTCTHGWKERHRGTGKRNAHGVRSTACPVKICATVQYLSPSLKLKKVSLFPESEDPTVESCWRVVVTKHIVDHNHNLSRELYQHYCENRRIYDPELLAIDTSSCSTVITRRTDNSGVSEQSGMAADGARPDPQSVLTMQFEAGLAEAVSHAQLFGLSGSNQTASFGISGVSTSLASVSNTPKTIPSVVLLPYSSTISNFPNLPQSLPQELLHQLKQPLEEPQPQSLSAFATASAENVVQVSESGHHIATVASGAVSTANLVLFNNAGMTPIGAIPPTGSNVISRACRAHGPLGGMNGDTLDTVDAQTAQCTCFRVAGSGNYVTIVPASEPLGPTDTLFGMDQDATVYAETDRVWQPSSKFECEKVTTESGDTIWRVPRIMRQYPTWDAFHKYLDAYSTATFQLYRVRTTYSIRSRNVRLRQLAASRGLMVREGGNENAIETEQEGEHGISRAHLVPEQYEWYSKTFLCTHGWKRRSRGSGQRMSHNVRATQCPAKVCATLQRTDGSSDWNVVVTKHLAEHNHELSETLYQQYSEVRRVRDPAVLAQAEQLWRAGATRRRVFEFLKERSPNQIILMKDVHNLVQRWQTQERRPRQESDPATQSPVQVQQQQPKAAVSKSHDDVSVSWL